MKISFATVTLPKRGAIAVLVANDRHLMASAQKLDKAAGGALVRAMAASRFKGEKGGLLEVLAPAGVNNSRVILLWVTRTLPSVRVRHPPASSA